MSDTAIIRVLVAEDDQLERSMLADVLGTLGYMVVAQVGSGAEAIQSASQLIPDAVLLDVHLPDSSGIDAAEAIVAAAPGTGVLLITGDLALQPSRNDLIKSGAVALLAKPAPPATLDASIKLAVSRAQELLSARKEAADAKEQLEARTLVERAKGILMRRTGSSEQEAYRIMQRSSQDRSVPMVDIARAVISSEPGARRAS